MRTRTCRQMKRQTDSLGQRSKSRGQRKHLGHWETGGLKEGAQREEEERTVEGTRRPVGADSLLAAAATDPPLKPAATGPPSRPGASAS